MAYLNEHSALLDPAVRTPAQVGDAAGAAPPANSHFGVEAFMEDVKDWQNGTVPISVVIAGVIGIVCGVSCFLYRTVLQFGFKFIWETLPLNYFEPIVAEEFQWIWIVLIVITFSIGVGTSIYVMGDPGDLKYTVKCVHEKSFIGMDHVPPMVVASLISIVGGGSLGPEAPLVAICAALGGFISRKIFGQRYKNLVRKHTLCGMACATAAFFGVPLGGALFALEVNNRLGYEYFEHALTAIFSGTVCLVVFRWLARLEIGPVWTLTKSARDASGGSVAHLLALNRLSDHSAHTEANSTVTEIVASAHSKPKRLVAEIVASSPQAIVIGAALGLLGALIAFGFVIGHSALMRTLRRYELLDKPVRLAFLGGTGICILGLLVPHTLFWGEFELQTIAVEGDTVDTLPHLWPKRGLTGFEIKGPISALIVGIAKLMAISITVASGYRGGFIFPFFCAGAGFGRAITCWFPQIHPVVAVLSVGAGINTAITRTALATPLILSALAGEPNASPPILAASLASIFATVYLPFITSQRGRDNIFESQWHSYTFNHFGDSQTAATSSNKNEDFDRLPERKQEIDVTVQDRSSS